MVESVLLISVDTLRQDVFDADCFPRCWPIFTSDFVRFPNALAPGVATPHSFPGIITGEPVVGDGGFISGATTLMERITGRTVVFTNNGHLRAERGYSRGADEFGDNRLPTNREVDPPTVVDRMKQVDMVNNSTVIRKIYKWYKSTRTEEQYHTPGYPAETVTDWVQTELRQNRPAFLWAHYMDIHKPFNPKNTVDPPTVDISKDKLDYLNDYAREDDPPKEEYRDLLRALYEANVRYLDRELARLLEQLREFDWYQDALVILVSDHGELFGEHGHMWHPMTIDPVEELVGVPLAVKYPQGECAGGVVENRVQHADIPATVEKYIGGDGSFPRGTYPLRDPAERLTVSKSNVAIRVTGPGGYVIRRRDGTEHEYGDVSDEMWEKAREAKFPDVRTTKGVIRGIEDVERMEQLKALGYR
jgi:hypothetical protein